MTGPNEFASIIEQSGADGWVARAACGDLSIDHLDLFFVEAGRSLSKEAAAMCNACEVRAECLNHAYERDITGGYFGGHSPSKRRADLRARTAG